MSTDLLSIYLNDHLGGSTFGLELARRVRDANRGGELGAFLDDLSREIEEDRETLKAIMRTLAVRPDNLKVALGWAGEKIGRVKPNGRLRGYSPLSRVLELEGLKGGVMAKLGLWVALRNLADSETRLDQAQLDELIERAERQLDGLRRQVEPAARQAFTV